MKSLDNSREGNDCWVHEHWVWIAELEVAVRVSQIRGNWSDNQHPEAQVYTAPMFDMPTEVRAWFPVPPEEELECEWELLDHLGTQRAIEIASSEQEAIARHAAKVDLRTSQLSHWSARKLSRSGEQS